MGVPMRSPALRLLDMKPFPHLAASVVISAVTAWLLSSAAVYIWTQSALSNPRWSSSMDLGTGTASISIRKDSGPGESWHSRLSDTTGPIDSVGVTVGITFSKSSAWSDLAKVELVHMETSVHPMLWEQASDPQLSMPLDGGRVADNPSMQELIYGPMTEFAQNIAISMTGCRDCNVLIQATMTNSDFVCVMLHPTWRSQSLSFFGPLFAAVFLGLHIARLAHWRKLRWRDRNCLCPSCGYPTRSADGPGGSMCSECGRAINAE